MKSKLYDKEYHRKYNENHYKNEKRIKLLYPERQKSRNRVKEFLTNLEIEN
jgi:hypothetical protein